MSEGKFYDDGQIILAKVGRNLYVYKHGVVGETDIVEGLLGEDEGIRGYSAKYEEQYTTPERCEKVLIFKATKEPGGEGFRLVVTKEDGKVIRISQYH